MDFTARFLDGASSANVTLHLHLAVGQLAAVRLVAKHMLFGPMDAVNALGSFSCMSAAGLALQCRERGVRASFLEVFAAPRPLVGSPGIFTPSSAMELHATPALMIAAPILLGVRPAGHPTREASITVVDPTLCMSHSMSHDMCVDVVAAMPRSRASHAPTITAPRLLAV